MMLTRKTGSNSWNGWNNFLHRELNHYGREEVSCSHFRGRCNNLQVTVKPLHSRQAGNKMYEELVQKLTVHYKPTPSETMECFKFHSRFRKQGESVAMFIKHLQSTANLAGAPILLPRADDVNLVLLPMLPTGCTLLELTYILYSSFHTQCKLCSFLVSQLIAVSE